MFIVQISSVSSVDIILIFPRYWNSLFHNLRYDIPRENAAQFSVAVVVHTVPIFVPPGTY